VYRPGTSFTPVRIHRLHIAIGLKARFIGPMPWTTRVLLTMKKEFIMLALQPGANLRELFRRYGISAPCGYKWLRAFQEKGFAGLEQKSRRPRSHPDEIGAQMQAQILS